MASPEAAKTSSAPRPVKPLHGRASAINYVRMSDRSSASRAGDRSELARKVRGWTAPPQEGSDEGKSQEAGAEQGDTTGRQGKESVGNEISISHDTPSDSDARP